MDTLTEPITTTTPTTPNLPQDLLALYMTGQEILAQHRRDEEKRKASRQEELDRQADANWLTLAHAVEVDLEDEPCRPYLALQRPANWTCASTEFAADIVIPGCAPIQRCYRRQGNNYWTTGWFLLKTGARWRVPRYTTVPSEDVTTPGQAHPPWQAMQPKVVASVVECGHNYAWTFAEALALAYQTEQERARLMGEVTNG